MYDYLMKTGANSVLLGKNYYDQYFPHKEGKLLKITKIIKGHDELRYLSYIRTIKDYSEYYIIPDIELTKILPDSEFIRYLKGITSKYELNIFSGSLFCMYIQYGGQMDVMDSLMSRSPGVWGSCKDIVKFSNQIMNGLKFLHEIQIAHLDIKPENIMIDLWERKFKIIDFGYSSRYPFDDFVDDIRGTPCYFPKHIDQRSDLGLPRIEANDLEEINGRLPMHDNRKFVYKIDSYCFGRVLNLVYSVYKDHNPCTLELISKRKIKKLMKLLLENDVYKRLTIKEILELN